MTIFQIALSNLRQRKLKSFLIMLGIALGISTMVATYNLLETMKTDINKQSSDYGANILISADSGDITFSYGGITIPGITYEEQLTTENITALDSIESREIIRTVVPKLLGIVNAMGNELTIVGTDVQSEFLIKPWLRIVDFLATAKDTGSTGDEPSAMGGEQLDLEREDYTQIELNESELILGSAVAYTLGLFPSNIIVLNGYEFTIKAILEKNGTTEDNHVLMNLVDAQKVLGYGDEITTIELAADYTKGSEEVLMEQIKEIMPEAKITSLLRTMRDRDEVSNRLTYFGFSVSLFILLSGMLVAGIGMSSGVHDQTREIGIYRAIGFRKSFIRKLILFEGIMLSLVGGIMGFISGTIMARVAISVLSDTKILVPWRWEVFLGSMIIALLIGTVSSVYPAQQAAKLDTNDSLRSL